MPYPELTDLVELVGRSAALAMLLEGRVFEAAEAERIGLVTRVVAGRVGASVGRTVGLRR